MEQACLHRGAGGRRRLPAYLLAVMASACGPSSSSSGSEGGSGSGTETGTDTTNATTTGAASTSSSATTAATAGASSGSTGTSSGTTGPATGTTTGAGTTAGDTGPIDCAVTLFVNFDGVTLTHGSPDDAPNDVSSIAQLTGEPLAPYDGTIPAAQLLAQVKAGLAPFSVCVTSDRPAAGPYTMVVVTGSPSPFGNGVATLGSLDCGNANPNNVAVVFAPGIPDEAIPSNVLHEFGHGLGLEDQNDDPDDVMAPFASPVATFVDACLATTNTAQCGAQHEAFCAPGSQNSYAELAALEP